MTEEGAVSLTGGDAVVPGHLGSPRGDKSFDLVPQEELIQDGGNQHLKGHMFSESASVGPLVQGSAI